MVTNGERKGQINWGAGIDIYTLLFIKQTFVKDLPVNLQELFCSDLYKEKNLKKRSRNTYVPN